MTGPGSLDSEWKVLLYMICPPTAHDRITGELRSRKSNTDLKASIRNLVTFTGCDYPSQRRVMRCMSFKCRLSILAVQYDYVYSCYEVDAGEVGAARLIFTMVCPLASLHSHLH